MSTRTTTQRTDRRVFSKDAFLGNAVRPSTAKMYSKAIHDFMAWQVATFQSTHVPTVHQLDQRLSDYMVWCFNAGRSKNSALHAFYGIIKRAPQFRLRLPLSHACSKAWAVHCRSKSHLPLPWELALHVARWLITHSQVRAGVAVLLAHHCYLRIGEVVALRAADLVLPGGFRLGKAARHAALHLRKTKTGEHQWTDIRRHDIRLLVEALAKATPTGATIFNLTQARLSNLFAAAIAGVGLRQRFTFHSLRHGGATQDCMDGVPISDIMRRGRWRSQRTCELYCQSGRAILATLEAPQELLRMSGAYDDDLIGMVQAAIVANHAGRI